MQRTELYSHHTIVKPLRRPLLNLRTVGAVLLASAVPACSDALNDLTPFKADLSPRPVEPDAGANPTKAPEAATGRDTPALDGARSSDTAPASENTPSSEAPSNDPSSNDEPSKDEKASDDEEPSDRRTEICVNACDFAFDGECDDGRPGSQTDLCDPNTDCADCGSGASGASSASSEDDEAAFENVALSWESPTSRSATEQRVASTLVLCSSGLVLLFEDQLSLDGDVGDSFSSVGFEWAVEPADDGSRLEVRFALSDRSDEPAPFTQSLLVELDASGAPSRIDDNPVVDIESVAAECLVEASLMRQECEAGPDDAARQAACDAGRAAGVL